MSFNNSNIGCTWKKNVWGAKAPLKFPLLFGAGSAQLIYSGQILDYSTGTAVPLASDKAMSSIIAIADCQIRNGDFAGYHMAIIPRPGDVFEYALAAASAPAPQASLYFSDSQTLKVSGTNVIAQVYDDTMIPVQGFQSVNPSMDVGTTIQSRGTVLVCFKQSVSVFGAYFP